MALIVQIKARNLRLTLNKTYNIFIMRVAVLFIFLLLQSINSISKPKPPFKYQKLHAIDMSKYAMLPEDQQVINMFFGKSYRFTQLSNADVVEIDSILTKAVEDHKKEGSYVLVNDPDKYYKQVLAAKNEAGEQEVYLNCLCSLTNNKDWRQHIIAMIDGGSCYFRVKMNLQTKKVISFLVNDPG
ncbi:hypothetical protein MTO98_28770 [Mucilaginibacter sp. SMC90]|uniref:hypothetical protein n=1 Tax=Mucilaginibacter sp. SMC90 TaxID=2929803 RepID=UPI001FB1E572|nr:hypothetical protein [Mucilaginibacter sp. SMC90]UOE48405.1 hypothetical protein MTO98_28770 [Mucilaginibacter sp. SMC90]